MRKLKIFFVTLICLLSSNVAFTLGVGDVEVKSALNDPLEAEIKLYSVQPGEGDNIRVNMATLKEFNAAGIDRPLVLSNLKFKVVEKGDGNAYIRVYSTRPIREPFLDFLVEIDWPSGRLLREYTLLLDPPVFAQRKAAPVQAATVAPAPAVVREEPAPAPAAVPAPAPAPAAAPVTTGSDDGLFPRIQIEESAPVLETEPDIVVSSFSADSYQVKKNDTLWSIAESIRPDSNVGVSQMMIALQRANPEAFANNNINGLRSGFVLRVPDRAAIDAIGRAEGVQLAREQNEIWRSAQDDLTTASTPSGTITTTAGSRTAPVAAKQSEPTVKLVTPEAANGGAQGAGDETGPSAAELALANEQLASKEKENAALQERVQSLEDQIGSMERLLELKESSLAELQDKLTPAEQKPAPAPAPEPAPAPVAEEKPAPAPKLEDKKPLDVAASDINPFALPKSQQPKALPKPPAPKPAPTPRPVAEPSLFDDPLVLGGGVAAAVLLLALLWVVIQRRRAGTMQFPESILTNRPATTTADRAAVDEETNLLSDFAPSSMEGAIETDSGEVDPLSEANVYLAYGKHQQAEELLTEAVTNEPERLDLKLKLMEVYHATGNADAFLMHAQEMHDSMDDQSSAIWDKACEMGRELLPGNELFGAVETGIEDDFSDLEGIADLDEDLEISLEEPEATAEGLSLEPVEEPAEAEDQQQAVEGEELSFDMEALEEPAAEDSDLSLDMDLGDFEFDTGEAAEQPAAEAEVSAGELDMGDLDIEGLDEALEAPAGETAETDAAAALELDVEDTLAGAEIAGAEEAAGGDEMLGMDEVATKLDLAKAYIDMGDPDGARSILDEVMAEGNDSQQAEAKELIDQL